MDKLYLASLATYTISEGTRLGFPYQVILGQMACETGWFKYYSHNNVLGIKGEGDLGSFNAKTKEEYWPGQPVTIRDKFASFSSIEKCLDHYFKMILSQDNFKCAMEHSKEPGQFILHIWGIGGYATAKDYPSIISLFSRDYYRKCGVDAGFKLSKEEREIEKTLNRYRAGKPRNDMAKRLLEGA